MWPKPASPARGYSLRRRLLARLFGSLAILTAGLFLFVGAYSERAADGAFDRLLLASALSIADTVRVQDGRLTVDLPHSSLAILAQARRDRVFYRVAAPDGALVTGYRDLPEARGEGRDAAPRFGDATYRGASVRVATLDRFVAQADLTGWVTITVAQTGEERDTLAREILANAFLPIALTVLAAAALVGFAIRQALAPLDALERVIRGRHANDLSPIAMPPPEEVSHLVGAINQLMARLKSNLDTMQTFLADAAHQIRTPLASLRLQAQLATDEDDPEELRGLARRVHRNAVEASELTSQLLNHAMVIHRSEALRPEPVDLGALLDQVVQRARAVAEGTSVRFAVDPAAEPATVPGDPIALREALTNLVDNAIKYAGRDGPVVVSLTSVEGVGLRVEVADHGPGIPAHERRDVLERFGRGSSAADTPGSGLGLAIVRSVAEAHGAALGLHDRPGGGLVVRMDFPGGAGAPIRGGPRRPLVPVLALLSLAASAAWAPPARAEPASVYPAPGAERERLSIHAATDRPAVEPLILDFQRGRPDVAVEFVEMGTAELFARAVETGDRGAAIGGPDLLLSSAADLQVKLVNDGYAQPHLSVATRTLPDWANWRDEAFGFTFEPAVIAYNTDLVPGAEVPRSREELIRLLRERPDRYRGRVATYDVAESGIGYLLAAHDSVHFGQFWQLAATLGGAQARLACCTTDILDLIERGEALLGYNVLGSYALARGRAGAPVGVVLPEDYTQVVSRVAVIPRTAPNPRLAGEFVDYLLSARGQAVVAGRSALFAVSPEIKGEASASGVQERARGPLRPITLGPALLVFLDRLKRERFLRQWETAFHLP